MSKGCGTPSKERQIKSRLIVCLALILAFCTSAFADPAAVVTAHSDAFEAAFTACDVPATLKLYENNAAVIRRMGGEAAKGKAEIAKLIKENVRSPEGNHWFK